MAQQVLTQYIDDLTGEQIEAGELTVERIVINNKRYKLDLGPKGVEKFNAAVGPLLAAAEAEGTFRIRGDVRRQVTTPSVDREQNQAIRDWARKRGLQVSDRGRIPADVVEAYHREN